MFTNKNYTPDKDTWLKYYVLQPMTWFSEGTTERVRIIYSKVIGGWYCEHCKVFHGRRVHRHSVRTNCPSAARKWEVCSVGRVRFQAKEWSPDSE